MKKAIPAALALLLIAGCTSPAPVVQVQEVTREVTVVVQHTVVVQQTVEVPVTVVAPQTVEVPMTVIVTATPLLTATGTATPKPTPTLAVEIPADWAEYEDPIGDFTLWHPKEWIVEDQGIGSVVLDLPGYAHTDLFLIREPLMINVGDEQSVARLIHDVMQTRGREYSIRVLSKGAWKAPVAANYAEFSMSKTDYSGYKTTWHQVYAEIPINAEKYLFSRIARIGTVSDSEIEAWKLMLASIQVQPEAESPTQY